MGTERINLTMSCDYDYADAMYVPVISAGLPSDNHVLFDHINAMTGVSKGKKGFSLTVDRISPTDIPSFMYMECDGSSWNNGLLVIDMDDKNSETILAFAVNDGLIPLPSFYIVNDKNGHAQAFWRYSPFPVNQFGVCAAQMFLLDRCYENMRSILHADSNFRRLRYRNPFYCNKSNIRVMMPSDCVVETIDGGGYKLNEDVPEYSLREIADFLDKTGSFNDGSATRHSWNLVNHVMEYDSSHYYTNAQKYGSAFASGVVMEGNRNNAAFAAAIRAARNGNDPDAAARAVRCVPALPDKEIKSIVKSAKKEARKAIPVRKDSSAHKKPFTASRIIHDSARETLRALGRKGGNANTDEQNASRKANLNRGTQASKRARALNRDKVMAYLSDGGGNALKHLKAGGRFSNGSLRIIAERLDISRSTLKRCIEDIVSMIKQGLNVLVRQGKITREEKTRIADLSRPVAAAYGRKIAVGTILTLLPDAWFDFMIASGCMTQRDNDTGSRVELLFRRGFNTNPWIFS